MGLDIININTPSSPALLASYDPTGHASYTAVTAAGNYAYVGELLGGTTGNGVHILDVSNPASPRYLSTVGQISGSGAQSMKAVGNTLYVAGGNGGLVTVDVGDLSHPSIRGRAGGLWAGGLDVVNDLAFVSAVNDGVYVFDVGKPASPAVRGMYSTGNIPLGKVLAVGNNVVVAEPTSGLLVLNVSNPSNPTLYQHYPVSCGVRGFDIVDDYIHVACGGGGVRIFRLPGIGAVTEPRTYLPLVSK